MENAVSFARFRISAIVALAMFAGVVSLSADELQDLQAKAEKGDAAAQYELAGRYAGGKGIEKDEQAALKWYLKAAERDYVPAYISLGSIYSHGFGVKQDWAESIRWFRKGALAGNRIAQHNLGLDYNYAHGVEQDFAEAAHWFRLGAEQGQPRCQYNLGQLYEAGQGMPASKLEAFILYSLASAHDNQNHIFGEPKAKEIVAKREAIVKTLTPAELETARQRIATFQASVPVHPRRFGAPDGNIGTTRGWYIWRSFNPDTWEAEVTHDRPQDSGTPEVFKVRMLPWATTYRYLAYGAGPEGLLPGERVNIFFNPDEHHKRGYLVHFQDEICQMKGHGHSWEVCKLTAGGFTARVVAGDKPMDDQEREFAFDPECRVWSKGELVPKAKLAQGDHVYMTWCVRDGKQVVKLLSDETSLEAIKKLESERLAKTIAAEGLAGRLESVDGDRIHFMIFAEHWSQSQQLKEGSRVRISGTGKGFHPEGPTVEATVTFRKNRGTYGSGVTDLLLKPTRTEDLPQFRALLNSPVLRVIRVEP
ncbi:MAG: sel1 repeat family protein [Planctomycetia bacterium]|nr:sel1 repeat family protein [Planctomycetia bacterium]